MTPCVFTSIHECHWCWMIKFASDIFFQWYISIHIHLSIYIHLSIMYFHLSNFPVMCCYLIFQWCVIVCFSSDLSLSSLLVMCVIYFSSDVLLSNFPVMCYDLFFQWRVMIYFSSDVLLFSSDMLWFICVII